MELEVVPGVVPSVLATMGAGESIFAEHGIVLYKEDPVTVGRKTIPGSGMFSSMKRSALGGLPFLLAEFTGPGRAAFSRDGVGEVRILELAAGQGLEVAEGSLLCAQNSIGYEVAYTKGLTGWMGLWMDRLTGPGRFAVHAYGNFVTVKLAPGEMIVADRRSILHKEPTMRLEAMVQRVGGGLLGRALSQEMYEVHGPGTIGLQTGR
ncbi:MAG: AIM24 family protein [Thermoplasmata archaeon]